MMTNRTIRPTQAIPRLRTIWPFFLTSPGGGTNGAGVPRGGCGAVGPDGGGGTCAVGPGGGGGTCAVGPGGGGGGTCAVGPGGAGGGACTACHWLPSHWYWPSGEWGPIVVGGGGDCSLMSYPLSRAAVGASRTDLATTRTLP
jgi:hypothetical protein